MRVLTYPDRFVAVRAIEALIHTGMGTQSLLLEYRQHIDGKLDVFTIVGEEPIRAASLHDLISAHPTWESLDVLHNVSVLWNGTFTKVVLHEIFSRPTDQYVSIRLQLDIQDASYQTEACETLQDAYWELQEVARPNLLELQTCQTCYFAWPAVTGPGWDEHDELACYRDSPLAALEMRQNREVASDAAQAQGQYFVHAFHRCAAWQARSSHASREAP